MAIFDYAFLCQFARLEPGGTLTAVGAGFAQIAVPTVPTQLSVFVVARLEFKEDEQEPVALQMTFRDPGRTADVTVAGDVRPNQPYVAIAGKVQVFAVVAANVAVPQYGLHQVDVSLNGQLVRTLLFEVVQQTPAP